MLQVICFSRNRPLQLHGYLTSIFAQCAEEIAVSVLLKTEPPYTEAYSQIRERFPYVHFLEENIFSTDVHTLLNRSIGTSVMFGCDDVVFTRPLVIHNIEALFHRYPTLLCLSLRLGKSMTHGMFGNTVTQPQFWPPEEVGWLMWDISLPSSQDDWAYPWEVLGTIYQREFVERMLADLNAETPSQFEERGSRLWSSLTTCHHMAAYVAPRIVVPTVNLVQTDYPGNGVKGGITLSPEFLLTCWNNNLRMDTERFAMQEYNSWRIGDFFLKRI